MYDFYIFYRNRLEGIKNLKIEQVQSKVYDEDKATQLFINKHSYNNNEAFDYNNMIVEQIMDKDEYDYYCRLEYIKEAEIKNGDKWTKQLNKLISDSKSFQIKKEDYQSLYHVAEKVLGKNVKYLKSVENKKYITIDLWDEYYENQRKQEENEDNKR